jgi:putative ABC transport system permease protein
MSFGRQLRRGVKALFRRAEADRDISDELQHYYDAEVAALIGRGLSRAEARRAARLHLGDPGNVAEEVRSSGWESLVDATVRDLRHAARGLARNRGFAAVCILTLAVGIGATSAIFSTVKPILLEPLPYPDVDRILRIADITRDGNPLDVTFGGYREIRQRSRLFSALATLMAWQPTLTGFEQAERIDGQRVGADYFRVLGVPPQMGRNFTDEEDVVRGPNVVIVSHGFWQRRLGGERSIIGRAITLNDNPFTVIGVMPADFENVLAPAAEVWAPLQYDAALPSAEGREWGHHLRMIGRLAPGIGREAATRELARIAATPDADFPRVPWASMERGLSVGSVHDELTRFVRPALYAVMAAVLLVLAIACVNVTSLLLSRASQRSGELALRTALGAGRNRLIGQLVVETMLLSFLGAAAAIPIAQLGVRTLIALSPAELPRLSAIDIDAGVFGFTFAVATLIGLLLGVLVALHASRRPAGATLHRRSSRMAGGDQRARSGLVIAQVALAVVLLISGGLLLHSLERLFAVDPGFHAPQLLTMQVQVSGRRFEDSAATHRFFRHAQEAVRSVPGVISAAFTSQLPLSGEYQAYGASLESAPALRPGDDGSALRYAVTPDYFQTMRIPLRRGRLLDARDVGGAPGAVVINESFAAWRFQGQDALGQRMRLGALDQPWQTIVGIVADVKHGWLGAGQENAVYLPTVQSYFADRTLNLVVRTRGDAADLITPIKNAIWSVDKDQPISRVATMEDLVARSAADRRFTLIIFDAFASAALLLAAIGLYGVLAEGVNAQVREIGVRSALGASRSTIVGMIAGRGASLTGVGLLIGLSGAIAAGQALRSLLFGISALDPLTYAVVLVLMLIVCAAASWLPALRAARIEPSIALRAE